MKRERHMWELYEQLMLARDLLDESWGVLDVGLRARVGRFTEEADGDLLDDEESGQIVR